MTTNHSFARLAEVLIIPGDGLAELGFCFIPFSAVKLPFDPLKNRVLP
jgi:hypothetical protein